MSFNETREGATTRAWNRCDARSKPAVESTPTAEARAVAAMSVRPSGWKPTESKSGESTR